MINTRDRSITHNLANMSFDQIFDLTAVVYFNITCYLNLLKTLRPLPPPHTLFVSFFLSFFLLSLAQTPHPISKSARVMNTSTHWISPHYLSRAIHAPDAIPTPSVPPTPPPSPPPAPSPRPSTTRITNPYIYATQRLFAFPPPNLPPPPTPLYPTPTPSNNPPSTHWLYGLQETHDKLVHSSQNRHICPLKGFIISTHKLSCLTEPPPPSPRTPDPF